MACEHDGLDAHADGIARHRFFILEKARVRLDCLVIELHLVRRRLELHIRLIETDMRVAADAKHLQVNAAFRPDEPIVRLAGRRYILCHPVGDEDVFRPHVHEVEEMLVHEIMVALRILRRHADVLIEIERRDLRKVEADRPMDSHEVVIQPFRRAARRETEHARRLQIDLPRNNLRRFEAHLLIGFRCDDAQKSYLLSFYLSHEKSSFPTA